MIPPRLLPCGPQAWLVELDERADVHALASAASTWNDVAEAVPGARTVLVRLRPHAGRADRRDAHRKLGDRLLRHAAGGTAAAAESTDPGGGDEVLLPVVYDGADLDDVAAACGLSVAEVVARHAAPTYRSQFCGFAPGFAYLTGLDPALRMPRRATPRACVPAGSVAIATHHSAVYPTTSPGGWHLLGRTATVVFDPARNPPALLTPGTAVRFIVERPS